MKSDAYEAEKSTNIGVKNPMKTTEVRISINDIEKI